MINVNELKAQMVRKGYTQKSLAKAIGKPEPYVSRMMKTGNCHMDVADSLIGTLELSDPTSIFFAQKST